MERTTSPFDLVKEYWLPLFALIGILVAGGFWLAGFASNMVSIPLIAVGVIGGLPLLTNTGRALGKGEFNVDVIAILSIIGGLLIHQYLPAAIIVFMLSGGEALEAYALRRASGSLEALLKQQPRTANRWNGKEFVSVAITDVRVGDRLLIKPGESVPVDAEILKGTSDFNEALLTGESVPVTHGVDDRLLSGVINQTGPVEARALVRAEESTYAKIVALVQSAQDRKGGIQRTADKFGAYFTPITLIIVALAWFFSHSVITAYAVLVIATPCPLLLATPIAFVAGIGRAAKLGIIVKSGRGLEAMARARTILFDKTGTLTTGALTLSSVVVHDSKLTKRSALSLAASLEQYSNHVVARSMVIYAKHEKVPLVTAAKVVETAGKGVTGTIDNKVVRLGNRALIEQAKIALVDHREPTAGELVLELAIGTKHMATITLTDSVRKESASVIQDLTKTFGFTRITMLTGDRAVVANHIAKEVGISNVQAELLPEDKLKAVESATATAHQMNETVMMVGDGLNDAPALERADIGIAIGKQGGEIAVEAADVVLLGDRLDKLTDAVRIGRGSLTIATQGIWVGMGLSFIGMGFAAFGFLPPVVGAVTQEVIDIVVILNALRVLTI